MKSKTKILYSFRNTNICLLSFIEYHVIEYHPFVSHARQSNHFQSRPQFYFHFLRNSSHERYFPNEMKWFSGDVLTGSDVQNDARAHVDCTWPDARTRYGEEQKDHRAQVYYSVMVKRLVRSPSGPYAALTVARATCTWLIIARRPSLSARDRYRYLPLICTLTRHCRKLIRSVERKGRKHGSVRSRIYSSHVHLRHRKLVRSLEHLIESTSQRN